MRLLPGRSAPGVPCRAVLVPAGGSVFVQVDTDGAPATLVLAHPSAGEVAVPLAHRPADPPGTACGQTDGLGPVRTAGRWTVLVRAADGRTRPVTWDGTNPVEDVALLAAPDPTSGWTVVPASDRKGRLVLDVAAPTPAAQADRVDVRADGIALAGRALGTTATAVALVATADDGRSTDLPVRVDGPRWRVDLRPDALPVGMLPMRWTLRMRLSDGATVPVGRILSDLARLPQVYRYPWSADPGGAVEVRPQFTYSRRLELHQRPRGGAR